MSADETPPEVTIDGAPASATFAAWIEQDRETQRIANGCRPCGSVLYRYAGRDHDPTCTRRAVAEALFGLLCLGAAS